jgi:hypothetical protein
VTTDRERNDPRHERAERTRQAMEANAAFDHDMAEEGVGLDRPRRVLHKADISWTKGGVRVVIDDKPLMTRGGLDIHLERNDVPVIKVGIVLEELRFTNEQVDVMFIGGYEMHGEWVRGVGRGMSLDRIDASGRTRAEALRLLADKVEAWESQHGAEMTDEEIEAKVKEGPGATAEDAYASGDPLLHDDWNRPEDDHPN